MFNKYFRKSSFFFILISLLMLVTSCSNNPYQLSKKGEDSLNQNYHLDTDYIITQYADATGQHASFYTIENSDYFLIIDGGWSENSDIVREVIAAHDNLVNAWIITHPHQDHAGAFNEIMADLQGITIEQIYDNGFDYEFIKNAGEKYDDLLVMENYYQLTHTLDNVTHLKRNDIIDICGLTVEVLNSYDDIILSNIGGEQDYQNNASLMLKITNQTDSLLICSDIKYDMDPYLTENLSSETLSSTYVQCGHHGNWSLSEDFYNKTGAAIFLMDAPAGISESSNFPASTLKDNLEANGNTVFDFTTAPNRFVLK